MSATLVEVTSISDSGQLSILERASVKITFESHSFEVTDFRVLRNKTGQLWIGPPSYSITAGRYEPSLVIDRLLMAEISDKVIEAFEAWEVSR